MHVDIKKQKKKKGGGHNRDYWYVRVQCDKCYRAKEFMKVWLRNKIIKIKLEEVGFYDWVLGAHRAGHKLTCPPLNETIK